MAVNKGLKGRAIEKDLSGCLLGEENDAIVQFQRRNYPRILPRVR